MYMSSMSVEIRLLLRYSLAVLSCHTLGVKACGELDADFCGR